MANSDSSATNDPIVFVGGCQCGTVRYRAIGINRDAYYCHCSMCRRAYGNIFATFINLRKEDVAWETRPPHYFVSSKIARRGFCETCGTPLTFEYTDGDRIDLSVGSLDHPERVKPTSHFAIESRLPAWQCDDGLPGKRIDEHAPLVARWKKAYGEGVIMGPRPPGETSDEKPPRRPPAAVIMRDVMPKPFRKVLIANRGEIAVRVARTLHEMGIAAVAVYSEADRAALHVRVADEAYCIGAPPAGESYLRVDKIIDAAKKAGCDAIHPGYGFLSENPALPEACERAGIVFIGPPASAMRAMGSKTAARQKMSEAGVPIVPGAMCDTAEEAASAATKIGFPVMLKASSGGGGKGMRLVERAEDMPNAWERARSEAKKFFGDDTVYLEKAILRPRHVEIQVLGDREGNMVHVFERDCSIQRRNQKVVEETPSPAASRDLVAKMGAISVQGAKAVGYFSAGTFEFLLAEDGSFYFLEMNTRLQVEHPVTELVSGLDLVREMVLVAEGEKLAFAQSDLASRGAAIECRVYAEDPASGFLPSPGKIENLVTPAGPGVRDDGGAYPGCTISSFYDPLISKLSVWAPTRERAIMRMRRALSEYVVTGIRTNLAFHEKLFAHPDFVAGRYDTGFLDRHKDVLLGYSVVPAEEQEKIAVAVAIAAARMERATGAKDAITGETGSRLAPWVAQHRARLAR